MNISKKALGKLLCAKCILPLSVGPVTINTDNTFVCGRCLNEGALVVTIYETLVQAQEITFPCQHEAYGCEENLKWGYVKEHEDNCPKQPYNCPAIIPCPWFGTVADIANHFKESHHVDYISETNKIEIRLDEDQQCRKIIKTKCGDYILYLLLNKKKLILNLKQLIDLKSFKKHQYKLKLYAPVETAINTEKRLRLGPIDVESYCSLNSSAFENSKVDVNVLSYLNNAGSSIFCEINIVHEKKSCIIKDLSLLMECPVCKELMSSPIYQCQAGHSFCSRCIFTLRFCSDLNKSNKCPLCNSRVNNTIRNYALEDLANKVRMS